MSTQSFLDNFSQRYLKSLTSSVVSRCHLVGDVSVKDYNKLIGKCRSQSERLTHLPTDQYIWGLVNSESGQLVSALHMTYLYACMGGTEPGSHHILQWSYAYTLDEERYRRQGCSLAIRLASMFWAKGQDWNYLNSVPLPGAHSTALLKSLDFKSFYQCLDDYEYYIYRLGELGDLEGLLESRLAKYY